MKVRKVLLAAAASLVIASVTAQITLASAPRKADRASAPSIPPEGAPRLDITQREYRSARAAGDWVTHRFGLFSIRTPAGWTGRGPLQDLYDAEHGTYFFEDGRGSYFAVNVDPFGSDFGADSVWRFTAAGDTLTVAPAGDCAPGPDDPFCSVGDKRLDIYVVTAEESYDDSAIRGHYYYFAFGHTSLEDADRDLFRRILESIRFN